MALTSQKNPAQHWWQQKVKLRIPQGESGLMFWPEFELSYFTGFSLLHQQGASIPNNQGANSPFSRPFSVPPFPVHPFPLFSAPPLHPLETNRWSRGDAVSFPAVGFGTEPQPTSIFGVFWEEKTELTTIIWIFFVYRKFHTLYTSIAKSTMFCMSKLNIKP